MNGYTDPAIRARELMLDARCTLAYVQLVNYANDFGECPACALAIDGYESTRVGHARTCRALLDAVCGAPAECFEGLSAAHKQQLVDLAALSFPATFRLRAWPAEVFRLSPYSNYFSDQSGVQLVVQRQTTEGAQPGAWLDFVRHSPSEIRQQIIEPRVENWGGKTVHIREEKGGAR